MFDRLNAAAEHHAETNTAASFYAYHGEIVHLLAHLIDIQRQYGTSVSALRNDSQGIVYTAMREYSSGNEASLAAMRADIATLHRDSQRAISDRRVMLSMIGAVMEHLGIQLEAGS